MLASTTRTIRQATSELQLLLWSRAVVVLGAVLAVGVAAAFVGSLSHARSLHQTFLTEVAEYEARGITLADALSRPVVVTTSGGQQTIDNPLKYDFLDLGKAVHAVQGPAMMSTALDFVTFLIIPLLFLGVGSYLANVDRRSRTVALRASRERWTTVTAGKLLALTVVSLATPVIVAVMGLVAGVIGSGAVGRLNQTIGFPLVTPTPRSSILVQILTTAAVCLFFGVLGYALGFLTRSSSWPLVLAAAALFVLPFVSAWDPRNLLAVIGSQVYEFWGQFRLRPPIELGVGVAIATLAAYLAGALAVVALSARVVRLR